MMVITNKAMAGTVESSDCMVYVEPGTATEIEVESVVKEQFGAAIEKAVQEIVTELQVNQVKIFVKDRGALDCIIKARVETALKRAAKGGASQ